MKSPFPGMDPYLEESWRDVHQSLCVYARDALQSQLGGDLRARVEERLVAEPLRVRIASEPAPQGFIHIIDVRHGYQVVTAIEFVSPSNKIKGDTRELYLKKQQECRDSGVSLVEIDLVRSGQPVVFARRHFPPQPFAPYQVSVLRAWERDEVEVYPISLRQRLPGISIPLRQTDPDAALDLQAVLDQAYRNGAYADDIDYRQACRPPLDAEDAAWADDLLRTAGRR